MATLGGGGKPGSLGLATLLCLHRLPEPIALAIHLENVAVVTETIEESRRHPFALEDLAPLAERQVARHQDAAALVAVGEDPEQQLHPASAHRDVPQLITDQQVRPIELAEEPVEGVLLLLLLQLADQARRREEPHPQPGPARRQAPPDGQMRLPCPVGPDETTFVLLFDPLAPR